MSPLQRWPCHVTDLSEPRDLPRVSAHGRRMSEGTSTCPVSVSARELTDLETWGLNCRLFSSLPSFVGHFVPLDLYISSFGSGCRRPRALEI